MNELHEIRTTPEKLFAAIAQLEGHEFKNDKFFNPKKCSVQVLDENSKWTDVKGFVIKEKETVKLSFGLTNVMKVAKNHRIATDKVRPCVFAQDIAVGSIIKKADGSDTVLTALRSGSTETVYDMEVDSPTHLYQTANGIIHHNSEKGKSLVTDVWLGQNIRNGGLSFKVDIEDAGGYKFTSQVVGSEEVAARIRLISPKMLATKTKDGKEGKLNPADLVITIERLTSILNKLIDYQISKGANKNKSVMVVIDSVSQLSSDKEITDIRADHDKRDMTAQQKMRALFRALTQMLRHANVTIVGIAHLTANIGVAFGDKKVVSAKGTGFGYASSLTLQAVSSKELADPKTKTPIGIRLKFKTKKNRIAFKGREAFLYLYFDRGIDPYGGLAELLAKYGLAKPSGKIAMDGSFPNTVNFTYETLDGRTIKFKATEVGKAVEANGGDALLKEWNDRLTDAYKGALAATGVSEDDLLAADPMDESGLEEYEE